jgi:ppGpp synthetase/RelA/SpoT-type nucleotidyltranferase
MKNTIWEAVGRFFGSSQNERFAELLMQLADTAVVGYLSIHYTCRMPDRYLGPRYELTSGIVFEVQVRTLCMHAWATVSHYLDYKGDWDVPAELKRSLSALSGLF